MTRQDDLLTKRLRLVARGPVPSKVRLEWLRRPASLSPWSAWALLAVVRYHRKQQKAREMFRGHAAVARDAADGQRRVVNRGFLPEFEWEFALRGDDRILTHRLTREEISFDESNSGCIRQALFLSHLKSLKEPCFVERELLQLHPSVDTLRLSIDELTTKKLLASANWYGDSFRFEFSPERLAAVLQDLEPIWHDPQVKLDVATAIGDWPLLLSMLPAGCPEIVQVRGLLESCSNRRTAALVRHVRDDAGFYGAISSERPAKDAVVALWEMNSPELRKVLHRVLEEGCPTIKATALEVIEKVDDPSWCDALEVLLLRLDPNDVLLAKLWFQCASFLLRHGTAIKEIERQLRTLTAWTLADGALHQLP